MKRSSCRIPLFAGLACLLSTVLPAQVVEVFGVEIQESDVVFCVDSSGSVSSGEWLAARTEIIEALDQLQPPRRFSIVAYGDDVAQYSTSVVPATVSAVSDATAFLQSLTPSGTRCLVEGVVNAFQIASTGSVGDRVVVLVATVADNCVSGPTALPPGDVVSSILSAGFSLIPIDVIASSSAPAVSPPPVFADLAASTGGIFALADGPRFVRGDVNDNGQLEIGDVVALLESLITSPSGSLVCLAARDVNADGSVEPIADAIALLDHLFGSGVPLPWPTSPTCGQSPGALTCSDYTACP